MTTCDQAQALANVYRLLGRFWVKEADGQLASQFEQAVLRDAYESLGGVVPQIGMVDELAVEYCRLFVGPQGHVPLVQSIWDRGQLESDVTDSMRSLADLFGYQTDEPFLDHFGVQLDLMGHALHLPDSDATQEALATYFKRHLLWSERLLQAVCEREDSTFYQALAKVTQGFLESERESRVLT